MHSPKPEHTEKKHVTPDPKRLYMERNYYFTGKYMTARDFRDEQSYLVSHQHWHQWTLHGWGIVWGLEVILKDHCVTIEPGLAVDCYGRELVLAHPVEFPIEDLWDHKSTPVNSKQGSYSPKDVLVGLQYAEFPRELVPLLLDDGCAPSKDTHNRTQEFAKICSHDFCSDCWRFPRPYDPAMLPKTVPEDSGVEGKRYLDRPQTLREHNNPDDSHCWPPLVAMQPPCECKACGANGFVPLARLQQGKTQQWSSDDLGRRYVPSPFFGEALTHIVGINWYHDGETPFDEFSSAYPHPKENKAGSYSAAMHNQCNGHLGRIVITFDRHLALPVETNNDSVAKTIANSIAENSAYLAQLIKLDYVVLDTYGEFDLDGDDPPMPLTPRVVSIDGNRLYCDFPSYKVHRELPVRLRLTLNCDMLMDDRGRAVDGDHIGGQVPFLKGTSNPSKPNYRSGNGTEGGLFYSWTTVLPESKTKGNPVVAKIDQVGDEDL